MEMTSTVSAARGTTPQLPDAVWAGWLSKFRGFVEPTTDAAIEGIFLVGSIELALALGRSVAVQYGRLVYCNLFGALIGPTGVPRKTTILSRGQDVRRRAFTEDFVHLCRSIGSAEGLLELFCSEEKNDKTGKVTLVPVPGQRVMLDEPELCNLLKKARRPGTSNITETLLALFDGDDLSPRTRTKPIRVEQPFFCMATASTPENLETSLIEVDIESGLMPRFGAFWCSPREPMAYPPPPDESELKALADELQLISRHAANAGARTPAFSLSSQAKQEWEATFKDLTHDMRKRHGLAAAIAARIPTMIMKWSLIYAAQAGRAEISTEDLARGTMVGTYLAETADLMPALVQKTRVARIEGKIVETLRKLPGQCLSANEIHRLVSGRVKAEELRRSLDSLAALGVIVEDENEKGVKGYRSA